MIVYQHNHVFGNRPFSSVFAEALPERLAPPDWLKKWTHAEIDAGADIVVMHGAPLLHGVEIYRGKPIFYDLGNFIYNLPPAITYIDEPIAWESVVADVKFQGRRLLSVTLRPIALNTLGEGQPDVHDEHTNNRFLDTRGVPAPATGMKATDILHRLEKQSAPFGTKLLIQGKYGANQPALGADRRLRRHHAPDNYWLPNAIPVFGRCMELYLLWGGTRRRQVLVGRPQGE